MWPSPTRWGGLSLRQIGIHAKPIVLCDPGNYWGPMLAACRGLVSAGLANSGDLASMEQFATVTAALDRLGDDPGSIGRAAGKVTGECDSGR